MKKTHPGATTSALSLIAITAGTVSVALVIMFVGLFLTMMSLGASPQSTANLQQTGPAMEVMLVADTASISHPQATPSRKGYFRDALLRNDSNRDFANSSERHPPKAARIYTISTTKTSLNTPHLIQT